MGRIRKDCYQGFGSTDITILLHLEVWALVETVDLVMVNHDLDIQENPDSDYSFVDPSNHHASVRMTQKYSLQEGSICPEPTKLPA
jgi:hypothetical protein